jgi:hypothetical protein
MPQTRRKSRHPNRSVLSPCIRTVCAWAQRRRPQHLLSRCAAGRRPRRLRTVAVHRLHELHQRCRACQGVRESPDSLVENQVSGFKCLALGVGWDGVGWGGVGWGEGGGGV